MVAKLDELLEFFLQAFGHHFYSAVGEVPDKPEKAELLGQIPGMGSEEHALNPSGNEKMNPLHRSSSACLRNPTTSLIVASRSERSRVEIGE